MVHFFACNILNWKYIKGRPTVNMEFHRLITNEHVRVNLLLLVLAHCAYGFWFHCHTIQIFRFAGVVCVAGLFGLDSMCSISSLALTLLFKMVWLFADVAGLTVRFTEITSGFVLIPTVITYLVFTLFPVCLRARKFSWFVLRFLDFSSFACFSPPEIYVLRSLPQLLCQRA